MLFLENPIQVTFQCEEPQSILHAKDQKRLEYLEIDGDICN